MSEEFNQYDTARFSEETRQLLATGMSALAAQESMGLATDANAETRRREAAELAADMERKNKENQLRRAAAVTGGSPEQPQPVPIDQKPTFKGRRKKKGLPKQEPTQVAAKLQPASSIPEQPVQPAQQPPQLPEGLTEADMALIEQVKMSRNRAMGNFLETHDTVHPNAYDARPVQQPAAPAPQQPAPAWTPPSQWPAGQQEQAILNEQNMAAFNGQGNPNYGQPGQYGNFSMPNAVRMSPPVGNAANTQAFLEATGNMPQPGYAQAMAYAQPPVQQPIQPPVQPPVQPQPAFVPNPQVQAYSGWDDEIDPDAPEEVEEEPQVPEAPIGEVAPIMNTSIVHAPSPSPFDPGVPDPDYTAFNEMVGFPSRSLFYNDKIYGQGLTTVDADMLSAMDPDDPKDVATTFTAILGRRVKGINPEDILSCDEEFVVYWLRESTYLEESLPRPKFKCEHCNTYIVKQEQLNMLGKLGFANQEFVAENDPAEVARKHAAEGYVRYTMFDGRECAIYLRRRKHDRLIADYMDGWERANNKVYPAYRTLNTSIAAFVEIEDCETMSQKIKVLEDYPQSKRAAFLKAVYDSQIVTKTYMHVKCPICGGAAKVPYSFQPTPFVASLR